MSAVNSIPCPRAYAEEHPCGEMTPDGRLCRRCESRLRHALRELPDLWEHLQVTRTRQGKTDTGGKRGTESPLPISWDAVVDIDAVIMTITTWVRDLQETFGIKTDPGTSIGSWCSWIAQQMHHIRVHPAVDQLFDELTEPGRAIKRTIDRPAEQTYLCACALCGTPVFGPEGVEEVECRRCREVVGDDGFVPTYVRAEAEQLRKEATSASHVAAGDLRTAVSYVEGITVNRKTMHSWITRNRLQAKACRAYHWVRVFAEGQLVDRLEPTWAWNGECACKPPQAQCRTLVTHELLYLVEDAVKLAREIPLRDLRAEETEQDVELIDHEAAYEKVLRVISDANKTTMEGVA